MSVRNKHRLCTLCTVCLCECAWASSQAPGGLAGLCKSNGHHCGLAGEGFVAQAPCLHKVCVTMLPTLSCGLTIDDCGCFSTDRGSGCSHHLTCNLQKDVLKAVHTVSACLLVLHWLGLPGTDPPVEYKPETHIVVNNFGVPKWGNFCQEGVT
jgi:hypothetical protein